MYKVNADAVWAELLDDGEVVPPALSLIHAGMVEHGELWFVLATRATSATRWGSSRATTVQSITAR